MLADVTASLPLLIMAAASIAVMLAIAIHRSHAVAAGMSLAAIVAALASLPVAASAVPRQLTRLLIFDSYALLYMGLLLAAAAFVLLFAYDYIARRQEHFEEFYLLVLLATTGAMVLVVSRHFMSFFLGLELLSIALFSLVAYIRTESASVEAGIKYLLLAASTSSILLFGMALIYFETGSMDLAQLAGITTSFPGTMNQAPLLIGLLLMITSVGFKLALAPFHLWTPDVYEGAPLPVTAFIAGVSKCGMFALVLRAFYTGDTGITGPIGIVLTAVAIVSMLAGNLLALQQSNIKRLLAYSSIAHMGYLLVALLAGGAMGAVAATYYLAAYLVTVLGALGVLTALSGSRREAASIDQFRGLFWERPVLAAVFSTMLLSLAGIPLTSGFLGKFYVVAAGAGAARWALLLTLVVSSTIGLYYYLRIIVAMFDQTEPVARTNPLPVSIPLPAGLALAALTALVFLLGVYPTPLWNAIQSVTRDLG